MTAEGDAGAGPGRSTGGPEATGFLLSAFEEAKVMMGPFIDAHCRKKPQPGAPQGATAMTRPELLAKADEVADEVSARRKRKVRRDHLEAWVKEELKRRLSNPPRVKITPKPTPILQSAGFQALWDAVPDVIDESVAGLHLNSVFGFARQFGKEPSYFQRRPNGVVESLTKSGLVEMLAPYKVCVLTPDGIEMVPACTWWSTWPGRYTVDEVVYDPENDYAKKHPGIAIENLWRGFAVQRAMGSWRRIYYHLFCVLCGCKKRPFRYLLYWLAHAVQHPGTAPKVMIVIRSDAEGVGKSTLGLLLKKIFGDHAVIVSSASAVFGEFNETIVDRSVVILEEVAFPGDHKMAAAVRNLVTNEFISINPKGRRRYDIPNRLHTLLFTNEDWVVPAGPNARRYLVLDVKINKAAAYFDRLYAEIEGGGVEAMLHHLLGLDLTKWNARAVPTTCELVRQQWRSAHPVVKWIVDCVLNGYIVPGFANGGFGAPAIPAFPGIPGVPPTATVAGIPAVPVQPATPMTPTAVPTGLLYDAYCEWSKQQGFKQPTNNIFFGQTMGRLGAVRSKSNREPTWNMPDMETLLAAAHHVAKIKTVDR
jgi:hypothetical protein